MAKAFHRATLDITWTVRRDPIPGTWHDPMDFVHHAARRLVDSFCNYDPVFELEEIAQRGDELVIKMTFHANLDMVPGALHQPEDYATYTQLFLHREVSTYSRDLEVTHSVAPIAQAA